MKKTWIYPLNLLVAVLITSLVTWENFIFKAPTTFAICVVVMALLGFISDLRDKKRAG